MEEILKLINTGDFQLIIFGAFVWYINKRDNQRIEIEKETKSQEIEERKKLIETIEENRKINQELLETNKLVSETNRSLAHDISERIDKIEDTLIEINQKVS